MPLNMPKLATDDDIMKVQPTGMPRPLVDESVVKQVTGLMSQDSPLMTQAKTAGLQQANQRGLLNSSMAVGSAQDSAYRAALPIASQEAAQRAQRNAQSIDIASRDRMQGRDIDATRENQIRDIESRFGLQANDAASLMERLGMEITSREGMQADEIEFRRQAMMEEIGARYGLQERDIAATMDRMERDIAARSATQEREIQYQTGERALDRGLQEQIASWNLSSSDRNAAAQMLTNMEMAYQEMYRSVMANPNLDAATRTQQLQSAQNLRNSQIDFVQQMYDIKLEWPRGAPAPAPVPAPAPAPSPFPIPNKIICGYFHGIGWLPRDIYIGDLRYGATLERKVVADYLAWATPVVRYLEAKDRPVLKRALWLIAKPWAYECAHRAGVHPKSTMIGRWFVRNPKLINAMFAPLVRACGIAAEPA